MATPIASPPLTPSATLRWDVVSRELDILRPTSVLELGCGQGAVGARLAERTQYVGVEPDSRSQAVAASRIQPLGGTVLLGDHTAIESGADFDMVCAFEVLEHIEDDAEAAAAWRRFVKPGGHLLLSVPAWQHRFGPTDRQVGHYRRYDPDTLVDVLEGAGFRDVRLTLYGWPLGYALETARNAAARLQSRRSANAESMADRTAASGRFRQPKNNTVVGPMIAAAVSPFRFTQRMQPSRGVGLVAVATRP